MEQLVTSPVSSLGPIGCVQPLHACDCLACDTERRANIRAFATAYARKLAARFPPVSYSEDDETEVEESGVRPTVRPPGLSQKR